MMFLVSKFCMKAAGDPFGLRHCDKSQSTPLTIIACDCHLRGSLERRLFIYSKDESWTAAQKAVSVTLWPVTTRTFTLELRK